MESKKRELEEKSIPDLIQNYKQNRLEAQKLLKELKELKKE